MDLPATMRPAGQARSPTKPLTYISGCTRDRVRPSSPLSPYGKECGQWDPAGGPLRVRISSFDPRKTGVEDRVMRDSVRRDLPTPAATAAGPPATGFSRTYVPPLKNESPTPRISVANPPPLTQCHLACLVFR